MTFLILFGAAFAANALHFALEKEHGKTGWSIMNFYNNRRKKFMPSWCSLCFFFWFGVMCSIRLQLPLDKGIFYSLAIAGVSVIIRTVYLRLIS